MDRSDNIRLAYMVIIIVEDSRVALVWRGDSRVQDFSRLLRDGGIF